MTVNVNGLTLKDELDTGSKNLVVDNNAWKQLGQLRLNDGSTLTAYGCYSHPVLGAFSVSVIFKSVQQQLELVVVQTDSTAILCRIFIAGFPELKTSFRNAPEVNSITTLDLTKSVFVSSLCDKFSDIFAFGLGKLAGYISHIYVQLDANFRFHKPRSVAFTMLERIKADQNWLLQLGVIELVETAECDLTPIVPVLEANGAVRISGDFKVTVNSFEDMQRYPLPHPEELKAALSGGELFLKVDLADAYLQMEVDEETRKYLVLSTHKGLYRYTRLLFGFHGAPAIVKAAIDAALQKFQGVIAYLDDILVTGSYHQEHLVRF